MAFLHSLAALLLFTATLIGCAARLDVPSVHSTSADLLGYTTVADVHVIAEDDRAGNFARPAGIVPVLVTIVNDSPRYIEVRYSEFLLRTTDGMRLAALPPFDLAQAGVARHYAFAWHGFHLAPHLLGFYRGFWSGWDLEPDRDYYDAHHQELTRLVEPTPEMQRRALPEGVLEPGGQITGILYFRDPGQAPSATLVGDLVDAKSSERVGNVQVAMQLSAL